MSYKWVREFPTEKGYYWFFGWCHKCRENIPEMFLVRVIFLGGDKTPMYMTNGHFFYEREGAKGMWMKAKLPEPPTSDIFNKE